MAAENSSNWCVALHNLPAERKIKNPTKKRMHSTTLTPPQPRMPGSFTHFIYVCLFVRTHRAQRSRDLEQPHASVRVLRAPFMCAYLCVCVYACFDYICKQHTRAPRACASGIQSAVDRDRQYMCVVYIKDMRNIHRVRRDTHTHHQLTHRMRRLYEKNATLSRLRACYTMHTCTRRAHNIHALVPCCAAQSFVYHTHKHAVHTHTQTCAYH